LGHNGRQILHARLHIPDRCFIALLGDRTRLLCERNGPRRGVGRIAAAIESTGAARGTMTVRCW
jgi:hypothetical protein